MSDLTREQIEEVRRGFPHSDALSAICDMALRTLDAEDRAEAAQENWSREVEHLGERAEQGEERNRRLGAALRLADEALATATGIREGDRWRISNARRLIEALAKAPPDSEPSTFAAAREAYPQAYPIPDSEPAEGVGGEDVPETIDLAKRDLRPKLHGWAPGWYANTCQICGKQFVGDKWAWHCARCAYKDAPTPDGGEGALASELEGLSEASHARADELKSTPNPSGRVRRERQIARHEGAADAYMQAAIMVRRALREPRLPRLPDGETIEIIRDAICLLEQSAGPFDEACRILRAADPEQSEQRSVPDE